MVRKKKNIPKVKTANKVKSPKTSTVKSKRNKRNRRIFV